ncbi:MAG: DUF5667 domain-containing protein [Patescibacteria group bacterium]
MKNILFIPVLVLMLLVTPALAQEDTLSEAGSTPASPFYFAERFFEGIGTFFTFGNSAKVERYLTLAEERLAEAKMLAEDGDERAQVAVDRYEEQVAKAKERAERVVNSEGDSMPDIDLLARVTDSTTKHLSVLDEVLDRVPEEARASIEAAKESSMTGQLEALRGIAQRDPERAVEIFDRAAEGRLRAAEAEANRDGGEDKEETEDILAEFEQYAEFGNEIADLAEGLQSGETTVEELVERATARHLEILSEVRERVPEEAKASIDKAMDKSTPKLMERGAPTEAGQSTQTQPPVSEEVSSSERSVPENSIDARDVDDDGDGIPAEERGAPADVPGNR